MTITNAPYQTPTTYQQQVVNFQPAQYIEAPELNAFTSFLEDFSPGIKALGNILKENRKRREEEDHRKIQESQIERRAVNTGWTPGIFTDLLKPDQGKPVATRAERDTNNAWTGIRAKDTTALSPAILSDELEFSAERADEILKGTAQIEGIEDLAAADWQDQSTIDASASYLLPDEEVLNALSHNELYDLVNRTSKLTARIITAKQDEQAARDKLTNYTNATASVRNILKASFGSLEEQENIPLLAQSMLVAHQDLPPDDRAKLRKFYTDEIIEIAAYAESIGGDDEALDIAEQMLLANVEVFPGWTVQDILQEQGVSNYEYLNKIRKKQEEVNAMDDTIKGRARAEAREEVYDSIAPIFETNPSLLANNGEVDAILQQQLTPEFLKRHGITLQEVPALMDEIKKELQPFDDDKAILARTQIRLLKDESPDIIESQIDSYFSSEQITEETYARALKLIDTQRKRGEERAARMNDLQKFRYNILKEDRDRLLNDLQQRVLVTVVDEKTGNPLYSTVNEIPYEVTVDLIGQLNSTLLDAAMLPIPSHEEWVKESGTILKDTSLTGFEQYSKPDPNEITRKEDLRVALDTGDILSMEDAVELVNDVSAGVIPEKWLDEIKDAYGNDVDDETVSRVLANLVVRADQMAEGYVRATKKE